MDVEIYCIEEKVQSDDCMSKSKVTVCVDFDGVLNDYSYYDENDLFVPRVGSWEFIEKLKLNYNVVILTARNTDKVIEWLDEYGFKIDTVTNIKVPALVYIDDRGINFNGDYDEILKVLDNFKTYWEKEDLIL